MKKGLLAFVIFLSLAIIGFVSAQNSLSDLLNGIDESTVLFFAIFLIVFSLLFFSLNRVFKKENTTVSGIISLALAFLVVYGVSKSSFDVGDFFSGIGISGDVLGVVLPIVIIAGIIFLIIKLKKNSLLAIGGLLILLSFFVYAKLLLIVVGVILIVVRFFIPKRKGETNPLSR
jgi:hypothetical protein